ncbi:hypothetical protein [Streptomyces erythrochromogenes]|uniref:hypothetical protein n=1 Tax=Streptomyces erythrochromogenes TaxID=285574 RepID=UPI0033DF69C0
MSKIPYLVLGLGALAVRRAPWRHYDLFGLMGLSLAMVLASVFGSAFGSAFG